MIYFARALDLIKIGFSRKPMRRVSGLRLDGIKPKLLGVMRGGFAEERALHLRFAYVRHHGEWFTATKELHDFIEANAMKSYDDDDCHEESDADLVHIGFRARKPLAETLKKHFGSTAFGARAICIAAGEALKVGLDPVMLIRKARREVGNPASLDPSIKRTS